MSDSAPAADAAPANTPAIADSGDELSVEEAMSLYAQSEPKLPDGEGAEDPAAAEVEKELAAKEAADSDPEKEPAEEETRATDPEEETLPPIERPRSWAKELDEEWASYPREAQERIAKREQERDSAIRRGQNEIAEQRKAVDAEREAVKALKQQYESQLPTLVKTLEAALQNEFADIKDIADVRKLQSEDPFRFQQWQLRQMELAAAQKEQSEIDTRNATERQSKWNDHVQKESEKFESTLSDKDKGNLKELMADAPKFLEERGFTPQELADLASGKERLSVYDHRIQSLILDGMKFRTLQNAPKAVAAKPLPPVQKPGAAKPPGAANAANVQALTRRLDQSGSVDDAFALFEAQHRA